MILLRSALFNLLFTLWLVGLGVVAAPALLHPRSAMLVSHLWMSGVFALLRFICAIRVEVSGREHISQEVPVIYAAKHQSAWETLYLWYMLDNPAFILKKQLLQIPVFGWYLWRSAPIAIDRAAGRAAMEQVITQGQARMEAGRSIVIFPEGTRTKPGTTKPYKKGVAALQKATGAAVVPIAHNAGLFWGRNAFRKYPGVIRLQFLPAMQGDGFSTEQLQAQVESAAKSLLP